MQPVPIVFVRKREDASMNWHETLRLAGINNCYLEGEMAQIKRNEGIKRLTTTVALTSGRDRRRAALTAKLIFLTSATSLASDMPRSGDTYLHRIGRTGRALPKHCNLAGRSPTVFAAENRSLHRRAAKARVMSARPRVRQAKS